MPTLLYPNVGALKVADVMKTTLANSELHLFKADTVVLSAGTVLADLVAAECDFTGYTPATLTAWLAPLLSPFGGASITSGTQEFAIASPYTVPNTIGGWWVETSAGVLICAGDLPQAVGVAGAGDGLPLEIVLVFGG